MSEVLRRSGRYVFRVHFDRMMLGNRDDVVGRPTEMEALVERSWPSLLAVDARDQEHAQEVADHWHEQAKAQRLMYETGKTA